MTKQEQTLVIRIDGGLGRVVAMSGAITQKAKDMKELGGKVKVITSWPLVFRGNPYIESVHGLDDRDLFNQVIKGNDYLELEPYTDPKFFNEGVNWLQIAKEKLGIKEIAEPILFLAEHEKYNNILANNLGFHGGNDSKKILFQPFGSMGYNNDKSYRSLYIKDAQYIADGLIKNGYEIYVIEREDQPRLTGCEAITTNDMRWVISLTERYNVLGVDSCMHHASKAFNKQAIVIRAGTDCERYGYTSHINLREFPLVAHTPMRLPMNSFDYDISNQYTNKFSKGFLDKVIEITINTFK